MNGREIACSLRWTLASEGVHVCQSVNVILLGTEMTPAPGFGGCHLARGTQLHWHCLGRRLSYGLRLSKSCPLYSAGNCRIVDTPESAHVAGVIILLNI